jgi:hypothetical protein
MMRLESVPDSLRGHFIEIFAQPWFKSIFNQQGISFKNNPFLYVRSDWVDHFLLWVEGL